MREINKCYWGMFPNDWVDGESALRTCGDINSQFIIFNNDKKSFKYCPFCGKEVEKFYAKRGKSISSPYGNRYKYTISIINETVIQSFSEHNAIKEFYTILNEKNDKL